MDQEFADLGTAGFSGTLNDRQFGYLRNQGLTGGLADMMFQWKVSGGSPPPAFTPASLFALGETGAWYRPNNTATVYQTSVGDAAGVVGQPVGLLHDLSKGFTFGPNLVSNPGPFTVTTGWTGRRGATISAVGGKLRIDGTASTNFPHADTSVSTTIGAFYEAFATASYVAGTDTNAYVQKADTADPNNTNPVTSAALGAGAARQYRIFFPATATTTFFRLLSADTVDVYDWDAVSFRILDGIPALQATAGDRPILRQEAVSNVYFLESVSSDTINWTAPAGTYDIAYVIPDGTVTILTGQSLSGATNIMQATQIVEYVAVNRPLTAGETSALTAYLEGVANP